METVWLIIWSLICFGLGVFTGSNVKIALNFRKSRKELEAIIRKPKPQNDFTDYTIEELEAHKKHLEHKYKTNLHYPISRRFIAEDLKLVLQMLEWHYDQNGTRDFEEQRARNKQELAEFDAMYANALKGTR